MIATDDVVASAPGLTVPLRPLGRREHTFAAVDTALIPWPEMEAQRAAIDRDLKGVVAAKLCVLPTDEITVRLDNIGAGHMFPSGAAHDRRAWVELVAYGDNDVILFKSGVVPADKDPEEINDRNMAQLWDRTYKADNSAAKFFWDIERFDTRLLKPAVTLDSTDPRFDHATTFRYPVSGIRTQIRRITMVVKLRPIPLALIDELKGDGLSPSLRSMVPTLELSATKLTWTPASAVNLCVN
jgi:hypothetical protein